MMIPESFLTTPRHAGWKPRGGSRVQDMEMVLLGDISQSSFDTTLEPCCALERALRPWCDAIIPSSLQDKSFLFDLVSMILLPDRTCHFLPPVAEAPFFSILPVPILSGTLAVPLPGLSAIRKQPPSSFYLSFLLDFLPQPPPDHQLFNRHHG